MTDEMVIAIERRIENAMTARRNVSSKKIILSNNLEHAQRTKGRKAALKSGSPQLDCRVNLAGG